MAEASDRAIFLELIKTKSMTIKDIVSTFNVSVGTARNWVKHENVRHIEDSWPPAYRRQSEMPINELPPVEEKIAENFIQLFDVPEETLRQTFDMIIENHPDIEFDFPKSFRQIATKEDIQRLEAKLISSIVMVRYLARRLDLDEGM